MKSNAATVNDYLASLPDDRRAAIQAVRSVILENLDDDYQECMVWGVPAYTVPQHVYPPGHHSDPAKPLMMCGVSSQKNDMVVYLMNVFGGGGGGGGGGVGLGGDPALRSWFEQAWAREGKRLCVSGTGGGGCCIRFKKLEDLALNVIGEAIRRTPARAFVNNYINTLAARGKRLDGKKPKDENTPRKPDSKPAPKPAKPPARKAAKPVARKAAKKVAKKVAKKISPR